MDVRPVGGGADPARVVGPVAPVAKPGAVGHAGNSSSAGVVDAAVLAALSEPDLARLATILERPPSAQTAARLGELLHGAVTAAAAGDVARTLSEVSQLVVLDPLRAEAIRSEPGLEPVRAQVDTLLVRLAQVARLDAEGRLTQAADVLQGTPTTTLPNWDARPETLLLVASRLFDSGGHVNYVRSAQVAQVVIDASHWAPAPTLEAGPTPNARASAKVELPPGGGKNPRCCHSEARCAPRNLSSVLHSE